MVDDRPVAHELPEEPGKPALLPHQLETAAGGQDRPLDLGAVAHDTRIGEQGRDLLRAIPSDDLWIEIVEGSPEVISLP